MRKLRILLRCLTGIVAFICILFFYTQSVSANTIDDFSGGNGFAQSQPAEGSPENKDLTKELTELDIGTVENYLTEINQDLDTYIPELNLKSMLISLTKGELGVSIGDIFSGLFKYLFREMVANSRLLGQLLLLAVLCAVLQNIQSAFEKGTVGKVAWSVCFMVVLTVALKSFTIAIQTGRDAIEDMVSFMHAMLPVMITLLTSMGNITTATLFHPLTLTVLSFVSTLIKDVVFPLIFFSTVLSIASKLSSKVEVSNLAGMFKQWSVALLGIFFTGFLGFMAVQGVAGSVADGVAMRTAKFGISAFVPVVGKLFSDTLEAVVGTSILLKNAVGIVGILAVFFICAFPILKIVSLMLIYKIAGALIEPVGDKLLAGSLNIMSNSLTLVFAAVASVGIMFFFVIAIIVGAGDFSLMLR